MDTIQVTITKKHTVDTHYSDRFRGALIRAAKEQQPDLNILEERDGHCVSKNGIIYEFDPELYTPFEFSHLKNGVIKEIKLTLTAVS